MKKSGKIFTSFIILGVMVVSMWSIAGKTVQLANDVNQGQFSLLNKVQTSQTSQSTQNQNNTQEVAGMTLTELAVYNGKNGNASYIAVDGIIYDVSKVEAWKYGSHYGLQAGQDLTDAFAQSPHTKSILNKAVEIGPLLDEPLASSGDITSSSKSQDNVSSSHDVLKENSNESQDQNSNESQDQSSNESQDQAIDTSSEQNLSAGKSVNKINVSPDGSVYTAESIKAYNGLNGNPAYIAVNGKVYDVTNLSAWSGGNHRGYQAGQDLSQAFASSPHAMSILDGAKVVGTYSNTAPVAVDTTSKNNEPSPTVKVVTAANTSTATAPSTLATSQSTSNNSQTGSTETWTLDKLAAYNGLNGNPAYIAVNGIIYDVTNLSAWSGGNHKGYQAGQDLSQAFASSPHSASILKSALIVASLGDAYVDSAINTQSLNQVNLSGQLGYDDKYEHEDDEHEYNEHEDDEHEHHEDDD